MTFSNKESAIPIVKFVVPKECQECKKSTNDNTVLYLTFPSGKVLCSVCVNKSNSILRYPISSKCEVCKEENEINSLHEQVRQNFVPQNSELSWVLAYVYTLPQS